MREMSKDEELRAWRKALREREGIGESEPQNRSAERSDRPCRGAGHACKKELHRQAVDYMRERKGQTQIGIDKYAICCSWCPRNSHAHSKRR